MKKETIVRLRFGPRAEGSGVFPSDATEHLLDLCWEERWKCLLVLTDKGGQSALQAFTWEGKRLPLPSLSERFRARSRLFRKGGAICLLARIYTPQERGVLLTLDRLDGRFAVQESSLGLDYDSQIAPSLTSRRRDDLLAIDSGYPITETIDYSHNISGSISSLNDALRYFPVMVGHPSYPSIRFSSESKTVAIGGEHMITAWRRNSVWHKKDLLEAIRERIGKKSEGSLNAYSVYSADEFIIFGVRRKDTLNAEARTVIVDMTGGQPRLRQLLYAVYAPPILIVENLAAIGKRGT